MARPPKQGLKYFSFDTDFFCDRKIQRLLRTFGCKGLAVFQFLLCEIYRVNGYYVNYEDNLVIDVANEHTLGENLVRDVVRHCVKPELFDTGPFEKHLILSSTGIQSRFMEASKRRKDVKMFVEFLLVPLDESNITLVSVDSNRVNVCNNSKNVDSGTQIKVNKIYGTF